MESIQERNDELRANIRKLKEKSKNQDAEIETLEHNIETLKSEHKETLLSIKQREQKRKAGIKTEKID